MNGHTYKMNGSGKARLRRIASGLLIVGMSPAIFAVGGRAAAPAAGSGVSPSCDETYYATLDYYGGLREGSIVKSYRLNGASELTDYGTYDTVTNLTDGTEPAVGDGSVTFSFDGGSAPGRFYFEGATSAPFEAMPWTLSLSYKLNGVPKNAEELAGGTGLVEVDIDAVPNAAASDYARDNFVLQAVAVFNDDDILSLEAPGAQVQMIGSMKVVLFMALPGEEQHFAIRVGSDSFTFSGVTFLMVPATLSQLDKIADLRQAKEDAEDSYQDLSGSLDAILDSLDGMSESLNAAADGLDTLDDAREGISSGKGGVYDSADTAIGGLLGIEDTLEPLNEDLASASQAVTDITGAVNRLNGAAVSFGDELVSTRNLVSKIRDDCKNARKILGETELLWPDIQDYTDDLHDDLEDLGTELSDMQDTVTKLHAAAGALDGLPEVDEVTYNGMTASEIESYVAEAKRYHTQYEQYLAANSLTEDMLDFKTFLMYGGASEAEAGQLSGLYTLSQTSGFDEQLEQMETADSLIGYVNGYIGKINTLLADLKAPSSSLLSEGAALCGTLGEDGVSGDLAGLVGLLDNIEENLDDHEDDINDAMSHALDAADQADKLLAGAENVIAALDSLNASVNDYVPKVQQSLTDVQSLNASAVTGIANLRTFLTTLEDFLKTNGTRLDEGTQKTLEGLSDTLRKSASSLDKTGSVRDAKNEITDIIDDEWESHTGGDDNMLNMDADAAPVSLTSDLNAAPESVQIVIRSQEIEMPDDTSGSSDAGDSQTSADTGTFFSRVSDMFRDFWYGLVRLFSLS